MKLRALPALCLFALGSSSLFMACSDDSTADAPGGGSAGEGGDSSAGGDTSSGGDSTSGGEPGSAGESSGGSPNAMGGQGGSGEAGSSSGGAVNGGAPAGGAPGAGGACGDLSGDCGSCIAAGCCSEIAECQAVPECAAALDAYFDCLDQSAASGGAGGVGADDCGDQFRTAADSGPGNEPEAQSLAQCVNQSCGAPEACN